MPSMNEGTHTNKLIEEDRSETRSGKSVESECTSRSVWCEHDRLFASSSQPINHLMNDWSPLVIRQHASDVSAKNLGNHVPEINESTD